VPLTTLVAVKVVAALPVEKLARLVNPAAEPASITYDVAAQPPEGGCQFRMTVTPVTDAVRPGGAPGGEPHTPWMATTISLEDALVPLALRARTRTKYVPGGTFVAITVVAADAVSEFTRSSRPLDDPTSRT
jgi:hypothetical protein